MFEVFTTLRVINGKPQWLDEHLARLELHAKLAGLKIPSPRVHTRGYINATASRIQNPLALIRLSFNKNNYEIKTRELNLPPPEAYTHGVTVYLSDQIATSQLKTNQRQVYDIAYQQAQEHGAFEGLLCNQDGYLVDGTRTSLLVRQGKTLTILEGGIEGITRQQICLQMQKLGFKIRRAYLKPSEIKGQLWLAGTGVGLLCSAALSSPLLQRLDFTP